jgi:pimeloyl-ACP methyl ester carboxylesterase
VHGFATRQFSYHTVRHGLDDNAASLHDFLRETPGDTVHVIGHSLGGVIALHALAGDPPARPGRIVCLGSPLRGSRAARGFAGAPFGLDLLGRSIREAVLHAGLPDWQGPREVGVIAGTMAFGLGLLFEKLPAPNDGTVAAEETRLPGIADYVELDVSHTGLLVSEAVAAQAARFLRTGRFGHDGQPAQGHRPETPP